MMIVPFAQIPDPLTYERRLSPVEKLVYGILKSRTNRRTGQCNPKVQKLAEWTGLSERTIQRALRRLRLAGWITIQRGGCHSSLYACHDRALPRHKGDTDGGSKGDTDGGSKGDTDGGLIPPYLFNEPDVSLNQRKSGAAAAALPGTPAAAAGGSADADQTAKTKTPLRPAAAQLVEDLMPAHPEPGAPDRAIAEALKVLEREPQAGEAIRRNHEAWLSHWATLDPHRFIPQLWRWLASGEWKYAPIDRKGIRRETLIERKDREQREHDERSYRMYAELGLWDALREYGQDPEEWRAKVESVA